MPETARSIDRQHALVDFGRTVATLPFNISAARKVLEQVEAVGGKELAIEAIATAAAFEAQTRVADATMRTNLTPTDLYFVNVFVQILLYRHVIFVAFLAAVIGIAVWWFH